ncbi:MAG: aminofutalosine synthase MqnE, partial [Helicobacter sp.]|nr:aminofutalosine synthase MqnE [Helicobacter sp.]
VSASGWLAIHRHWHKMGKKSNATMLFGHIENRAHRIDHLLRLQQLQAETGGFNAFIPLVYQKENNFLHVTDFPTGQEILKTIAIARMLLPNIPHIKAYWATLGINMAMVAQEFGADALDGTIQKESIQSAGGASSAGGITKNELVFQIKNAGFVPVERDTLYNEIHVY